MGKGEKKWKGRGIGRGAVGGWHTLTLMYPHVITCIPSHVPVLIHPHTYTHVHMLMSTNIALSPPHMCTHIIPHVPLCMIVTSLCVFVSFRDGLQVHTAQSFSTEEHPPVHGPLAEERGVGGRQPFLPLCVQAQR